MKKQEENINLVALNCNEDNNNKIVKLLFQSNKELDKINIEIDEEKRDYKLEKISNDLYYIELKVDIDIKEIVVSYKDSYIETISLEIKNPTIFKPVCNKVDLVGIDSSSLVGINNPAFNISGSVIDKKYKVKILADGEEVETYNRFIGDETNFALKADLNKDTNIVKFVLSINDKDFEVRVIKNSLIQRIRSKIVSPIKRVVRKIKRLFYVLKIGIRFLWKEHHLLVPPYLWPKYYKRLKYRLQNAHDLFYNPFIIEDYHKWLKENSSYIEKEEFSYNPLISVIIPVYNVKSEYLEKCIDSVLNQSYQNFEVCLVDDCSTKEETINTLKKYEEIDDRIKIKYRKVNGNISAASNDAINMAKGEFIALLDNDDILDENALYYNVKVLNEDKKVDFIYSDEDKIDLNGKYSTPNFKPDYSPDTLMSCNYICHFSVIRKKLVDEVGGFEVGLEGAQDYDLFLKIVEKTNKIYHIPKILYHWRKSKTSTAMNIKNKSSINDIGIKVIENALKRRKLKGKVTASPVESFYIVDYEVTNNPLVSIIIPTKDYAETLETCLSSLFEKTTYKNYEVIVVNNNSEKQETFDLFDRYKKEHKNFKVIDANFEFNYSKINNLAVEKSKGEYLVLLNNDTEVIDPNWLGSMLGYAMLPHVGAVGPKLLFPDDTIQHAGVILGLGGVAGHAYSGSTNDNNGYQIRLRIPFDYGAVTAACLMIKKSKYLEVGGLEEELKVAYNDVDFNIKLLEKGYYNICVPQIEMYHYESKSRGLDNTSEKYKRFLQESKYMHDKWDYILLHDPFYNPNFSLKYWFVLDRKRREKD